QRGVEQMLGFGEAAQAGVARADLRLHALQLRGGAEAAQRADDGIDQREEKKAQVIGAGQAAAGIGPGRVERGLFQQRDQAGAEIGDEFPSLEILIGKRWRDPGHALRKAEVHPWYKLQKRDKTAANR